MIDALSKRMASFFVASGIAAEEDEETYAFGVGLLLATVVGYAVILAVALLMGNIWLGALYLACIVPLRIYCGGYHAQTHLRCNTMFALVFFADLVLWRVLCSLSLQWTALLFVAFSLVCVGILAPVSHKNRPLSAKERKKYRRISLILIVLESAAAVATGWFNADLGLFIAMALFVVSTLMITAIIIERGNSK